MANRYPLQQPQMQPRMDFSLRNNVPPAYPTQRHGAWPHHTAQQLQEQNEKQREYLKQQQKLRLMTATQTPQPVSADALIENLLGKKETFKPKPAHHTFQPSNQAIAQHMVMPGHMGTPARPPLVYPVPLSGPSSSGMIGGFSSSEVKTPYTAMSSQADVNVLPQTQFAVNLPVWLNPSSPQFPQFYQQVWKIVGQQEGLADTARIFPLLLTSGLPTDILGYIWGLANHKVAGQLTEQELYIVLALVALAQNGCTFGNLNVLNLIPQAPIPNLKIDSLDASSTENSVVPDAYKMKREDLNLSQLTPVPVSEPDNDGFDEFTDFQSATTVVSKPTQTSDNDLPKVDIKNNFDSVSTSSAIDVIAENSNAKCPNVMVLNTGHGRGIGSRLANHSLGAPKQKKSKHHHHRHHHHHSQPQVASSVSVPLDEDFSEFQQAVKTSADSSIEEVFPKCNLKPAPQGKTYLLKESAIRSEIKLDSHAVQCGEGVKNFDATENNRPSFEDKVEKDKVRSSPGENAFSLLSANDSRTEGINLMAVEEDKYSALRNLTLTNEDLSLDKPTSFPVVELSPTSDDFGDFLSAEPAQNTNDAFADIATRDQAQSVTISNTDTWKSLESSQEAKFEVDDWGDFKDAMSGSNQISDVAVNTVKSVAEDVVKEDSDISSAFMNLDLTGPNSCSQGFSQSDANIPEKENLQIFSSLSESTAEKSFSGSVDLKLKYEDSNDWNLTENTMKTHMFEGFLGKIYDDGKPDHSSGKADVFCLNTDDRSNIFNVDMQTQNIGSEDDEFGEFVGSDAWAEESKHNAAAKDMFDGHLGPGFYADTQSVSSLELPPLALSRHGSVPSLDLKIFPSTSDRNGGNGGNQPWDLSPQGIEHQLNEWHRCLQSCLMLLQSAVEIFSSILSEQVLDEVLTSAEGKDYLNNILEVAGVTHRVECSYKQLASCGEDRKLDSLLVDINKAWSSLKQYYTKADISMNLEDICLEETGTETTACCGVCLIDVNNTKTNNKNTSQLEYGGYIYHSVCANLWVNCVDSSLPALAVGNSSFL